MRVLLVVLLIHGLVPSLAEVAEAAVHVAWAGQAEHGDGHAGDRGCDPGCGATLHHCACCAAQAVATPDELAMASADGAAAQPLLPPDGPPAARALDRPFRPPIS